MAEGDEDRTQAATPKRLETARAEGNVAQSRELPALASLGAATLVLMMTGPQLGHMLAQRMMGLLSNMQSLTPIAALRNAALAWILAVAPLALAVAAGTAASVLLQTGFLLNGAALMPRFNRLDPRSGLKRILGVDGLMEQGKSLVKLGVLGFGCWHVLSAAVPSLGGAVYWLPGQLMDRMMREVLHLMLLLLAAQAAIAGADVLWKRYRHAQSLRMSREEVRREHKESDGNPQIKAKIRQLRNARARRRMMAAVPKATVVVTNPTHYAIALVYDRGQGGAPRVVAKGVDEMAARIREVAKDNRVPLVANPPLARALYSVEVDSEIPPEHFKAVAEIIAYVWRLRGRAR
ncbi:MAG: EscU/YscU/HrcU family type III secretion system export apparatus switch protein [Acetobacteraceae bacterium]